MKPYTSTNVHMLHREGATAILNREVDQNSEAIPWGAWTSS